MSDTVLKFFSDYIELNLGIVYTHTNYYQLEHRLQDVAHQLGLKGVDELYAKAQLSIDGQLRNLLLDLATNNETSFFRDVQIFNAIAKVIVPDLKKRDPHLSEIKLWSAASSSGQEIYSIAMEVDLQKKISGDFPSFSFLASDISDTILKRAKEGIYSQLEVQRGLPDKNLIEYFDQIDGIQWKVKEFVKKNIEFKKINLLEPWGNLGPFEIIFCRNVLIYQNVENKKKVVEQFIKVMRPGSFLVLGAAESLFGISDSFDQVTDDKVIVYRLKS